MTNNINNDINKFDGKYLKCIVSKYPSVIKFLANSGSMIVLQPQNEMINQDIKETNNNGEYYVETKSGENQQRNYIYLGNEFLASGYGFSTIQYRKTGERIIKSFDNTIRTLKKSDEAEAKARKEEDDKIWNNFANYVAVNGGSIGNTIINFGTDSTRKIKTRDIILYGEEAQYLDLQVNNTIITLYDNNGYTYDVKDGVCVFPFGGVVASISVEIIGSDNDSGGLNYLEVLHDFHHKDTNYDENEGIIVRYDTDVDNKVIIEDNIDPQYNVHKWYYFKQLNNSTTELIIDETKNNVIKDIYLYVKETPTTSYKYYPGLLKCKYINSDENVKLISSGNAIKPHKINLGLSLSVKPQYYIKYNFNSLLSLDNFDDNNIAPLNITDDNYTTDINIYLDHNLNMDYKYVQVAVPVNFSLRKLYLVKNNLEKFNLTGAVYKVKSNVPMPCPKSKLPSTEEEQYYTMKYDIYMFTSDTKISSDTNVLVEVVYDGKSDLSIERLTEDEMSLAFTNNDVNKIINDEEFNNLYWVDGNRFTRDNIIVKLNNSQENGLVKYYWYVGPELEFNNTPNLNSPYWHILFNDTSIIYTYLLESTRPINWIIAIPKDNGEFTEIYFENNLSKNIIDTHFIKLDNDIYTVFKTTSPTYKLTKMIIK